MADIRTGNFSDISGEVNIAAGNIIKHIQTIYERALTPGEVIEKDLEIEVNELARGVRGYLERLQQQVVTTGTSAPYKGLESYALSDAQIFFGRDQDIRDLEHAIKRSPLTILQAESGAGKTSLLKAGLIPRVIARGDLAIWVRSEFTNPARKIKESLIENLELTPKLANSRLVGFLRRVSKIIGHDTTLILILDQFEEFFSKLTSDQDRRDFIEDLAACLNDATLNVRWVISITTDSFGQLGKFEPQIQNPFSNQQSLYLFNRQQAIEIITKPAASHGLEFEAGLLDRLLDDLLHDQKDKVAPTQIQLVCEALYNDLNKGEGVITQAMYDAKGGAEGILHDYIGNVMRTHIPPEERSTAYKILEALVTSEKKRIIRSKTDLTAALEHKGISHELTESTLYHLLNRRLLRQFGDGGEQAQYELVHDYLLGEIEIDEELRKVKEADELLEQGVRQWKKRGEVVLTLGALKNIDAYITKLFLNADQKELLLVTALEYNYHIVKLATTLTNEERLNLVAKGLQHLKENQGKPTIAYKILWVLRSDLPKDFKTRVLVWKIKNALPRMAIALTVAFLILFALIQLPDKLTEWTGLSTDWEPINNFTVECNTGSSSSILLIAHDPSDTRRVLVTGEGMNRLCLSEDSAYSWNDDILLPVESPISLSTNNERVYISSRIEVYFRNTYSTGWIKVKIPPKHADKEILSVSVNTTNPLEVYVTLKPLSIIGSSDGGNSWKDLDTGDIQGNITAFASNRNYMIITTDQGYWFKKTGESDWIRYQNSLTQTLPIAKSISIFDFDEPNFFLTTAEGKVWSVYLNEDNGLYTEDTWPNDIYYVSTLYTSWYASGRLGLYCNESWTIFDVEWWRWQFNIKPPCY